MEPRAGNGGSVQRKEERKKSNREKIFERSKPVSGRMKVGEGRPAKVELKKSMLRRS